MYRVFILNEHTGLETELTKDFTDYNKALSYFNTYSHADYFCELIKKL